MKIGDEVIVKPNSSVFVGRKGLIFSPVIGYYKRWLVSFPATATSPKTALGFRESMLELSKKSPRQKTFEFGD